MLVTALHDWLSRIGARAPSLEVVPDERGGRMVRATEDIPAGTLALLVPRKGMLSLDVARRSSVGQEMQEADIDPPSAHSLLAAYLLVERRRPDSPFATYLATLPSAFPMIPLFHHRDVLPVLRGTFAGSLIVRRRDMLLREFAVQKREVRALGEVGLREYLWARTVVITRVFGITIKGGPIETLVPLADMLNHRRPPDVDWCYDDEAEAFIMRAARDIRRGEEVTDSYGRKPNGRYFVHYGFALEEGADDEVELTFAVAPDDPLFQGKQRTLRMMGGHEGQFRISNKLRGDETQRAFSFLRTAVATESEIPKAARLIEQGNPVTPLSCRNEAAALAILDRACEAALRKFESPDTDEDEALLARPDLPVRVRQALLVRRGEKRLLHSFRRLAAEAIPLLRLPRKRFFAAAAQWTGEKLTTAYLLDVALALAPREARPPSWKSVGL